MLKSLRKLNAKLRKSTKSKNTYKARFLLAKKALRIADFDILSSKLSPAAQTLIKMQFELAGKKIKARRFTLDQKILALSIYKPSPKAYRLLSNICILPRRKTLQRVLQKVQLRPGNNKYMFDDLKRRVQNMPPKHRLCTIVFDEMALSPGLSYDTKNDAIIGFEDSGKGKTKEFADHVLVFMVRGIVKKYKQPVAYTFCSSTTKTIVLKNLIKDIVTEVQNCGLKVVATVCDQGATNLAAINDLINETKAANLRKNIEFRGGYFEIQNQKIFALFDPPHLMKGIRNNLLTKTLVYKINGKNAVAKWPYLIELYKRGPRYRGVRLLHKLTIQHVFPNRIPKMKVKNCTQVFSQKVGTALGYMAGMFPYYTTTRCN